MEPKIVPKEEKEAPEMPTEEQVEADPEAALKNLGSAMEVLEGSVDKAAAQSLLVQILGHEKVGDDGLDAAWELLNKVNVNEGVQANEDLLPDVEAGVLGEKEMDAAALAELYPDEDEDGDDLEDGEDGDGSPSKGDGKSPTSKGKAPFKTGLSTTMMWQSPQHIRGKQPEVLGLGLGLGLGISGGSSQRCYPNMLH